jgi:hypothetical protein
MRKEAVMAYFKVIFHNFFGGTDKNHETSLGIASLQA